MGLAQQQQEQAQLDTQAQANQMIAMMPQQQLGFFGNMLTGLMGGYPGMSQMTYTPGGGVSPMMNMLGTLGSVGGAIGGITSLFR